MKYVSSIFLLVVVLNTTIMISGMEKKLNKETILKDKIKSVPQYQTRPKSSQKEQDEIDKKDHERIQSASHLKIIPINPDASPIFQVMTVVRNHVAIHNQVAVYDAAQDINYAQFVICKTVDVVDGLSRLAKL